MRGAEQRQDPSLLCSGREEHALKSTKADQATDWASKLVTRRGSLAIPVSTALWLDPDLPEPSLFVRTCWAAGVARLM
jgi:hypothetical protein